MLKAHNEYRIPLHEWAFDPLEMAADQFNEAVAPQDGYQLYHGYTIREYGARRLDSLQYFYSCHPPAYSSEKPLDFVFGYTSLKNSGRAEYRPYIQRLLKTFPSQKRCLFIRDDEDRIDTLVSKSEYMRVLAQSRYTLLLPAYDKTQFSIYRLLEALAVGCLPILHPHVSATAVERSFGVDLSILRRLPSSERRRRELLEEMKSRFMPFRKGFVAF
jgi:hypothetical protein